MYMRTTKRHNKDGSTVEYYQLAETRWDPTQRRPTAHIIHNFGRADTLDREALLRLAQSISRVCQGGIDIPPEVSPPGEALDIEWARPLGVVHVARALWEELGIGEVLRGLEPRGPRRAPHELALFTMVANRLAEPLSKLACYEYWRTERAHIPPDLVVRGIPAHRKPPEVRIWRLRNQSAVGTRPPSTSTPH
jgi:hypothetical protein